MAGGRQPGPLARGGEFIPPLRPARPARLGTAFAALALVLALGALVASDAGAATKLAWAGTCVAALLVASGAALRSTTSVHAGVALLGALLLLRQDNRLVLAPPYGSGLLLIEELAIRCSELAGVGAIGPAVIGARVAAVLAIAALGACAGAGAAIAVTAAPGRSVALTALGALSVIAVCGAIARHARRIYDNGPVADGGAERGDGAR